MVEEKSAVESENMEVEILDAPTTTTTSNGITSEKEEQEDLITLVKEGPEEEDDLSISLVKEEVKWNDKKAKRRAAEDPLWVYNGNKKTKNEEDDLTMMDDDMFDWPSYLVQTNSKAVPSSIFKHIVPECMCGFEPGMKLEVPNKDYKNTYWLATIVAKATPLILVRYEGFQDNNEEDFWCNTLSDDIHPVGWCARSKHALKPPKAIQHKEQNWYTYLIRNLTGAKKASENLFLKKSHPAHYLRAGQYIEILDPYNPRCYWLARLNEVFQGRLNLQYEGWDGKAGEFWCFYLHESLRPVGHGIENELKLCPPKGAEPFSQIALNRLYEKVASISKRIDNSIFNSLFMGWPQKCPHNLTVGLKLEAIHPTDPTSIHVASVARIFNEYYFLVQIDTLLSQGDVENSFVAHKCSSHIFHLGSCTKNGLTVCGPPGYIGKFSWDAYLKYSKAEPVPEDFFEEIVPNSELEVGMKLEAVDKENPPHICVCTITKIIGGLLWLHIDGDARSEQIFSINSKNIFPIGWCESTGHELQWPRPNTLEQKNRISSLRSTVTRQNRLEVLRKGKLRQGNADTPSKDVRKDFSLKQKNKSRYRRGHRGHARKRINYDDSESTSYADNTLPIVCINQLAKEYNTEESIKKSFGLDSNGRLPTEIVTIDDDDDDDDDPPVTFKNESRYNERDIAYLSYIRVKPKNLTKSENELFEQKLKENDGNRGATMDALNSPNANREKRSLNSVVAMLRSTSKQTSRTHLLEQYKQSKAKKQERNQCLPGKENAVFDNQQQSTSFIDLSGDTVEDGHVMRGSDTLKPDSSVNIPGKGEYRIVEKIVTKQGDKNKIILKLGKPVASQAEMTTTSAPSLALPILHTSSPSVQMTTTNVNDMHTVQNMVRNHPGLNEIMKTRCHKVRGLCKDLPKNPLLWTKRHVAMFIQNADFKKYAKRFFDQDVDGHSLLLLTVWEIHHILGVQLGPAMKIHDYIFSLQQLVNDAYLKSKNDGQGGCTSQATEDSIILERDATASDLDEESLENFNKEDEDTQTETASSHQNIDVMKWVNDSALSAPPLVADDVPVQFTSSDVTVNKETLNTYTSSESLTETLLVKSNPLPEVKPIIPAGPGQVRIIYHPIRQNMPDPSSGEYALFPSSESIPRDLIQYRPPYIDPYKYMFRPPTQLIPIHYIQHPQNNEELIKTSQTDNKVLSTPQGPQMIIPYIPSNFKRGVDGLFPSTRLLAPVQTAKPKKPPDPGKATEVKKSDPLIVPTILPNISGPLSADHPEKYIRTVHVELESQELWNEFHKLGTEMILTRAGRRMFPTLQVSITGMDPKAKYVVLVDFAPADHYRYKFEYESSEWLVACEETTPPPGRVYVHPESPANGDEWMRNIVDFTRCKLTNNLADCRGHILMHSMHKYQPRLHVIYWDGNLPLQINPFELLRVGCRKEFVFSQTQFIAVTAYQNSQITHLKIESNPFARGFRGDWRKYSDVPSKKARYAAKIKEEPLSHSPEIPTAPTIKTEQLICPREPVGGGNLPREEQTSKLSAALDDRSDDNDEEMEEDCVDKLKRNKNKNEAESEGHASECMESDNG